MACLAKEPQQAGANLRARSPSWSAERCGSNAHCYCSDCISRWDRQDSAKGSQLALHGSRAFQRQNCLPNSGLLRSKHVFFFPSTSAHHIARSRHPANAPSTSSSITQQQQACSQGRATAPPPAQAPCR